MLLSKKLTPVALATTLAIEWSSCAYSRKC